MKWIYISFIVLLSIGVIVLTILNVLLSINRIDPKNCGIINGEFIVTSGSKIINSNGELDVIEKCGSNGSSLCNSNVSNLHDAIEYCNSYASICNSFLFHDNTVSIVNFTDKIVKDNGYDLYTR